MFNPLKSATGEVYNFGLVRIKKILTALDVVPEAELDLSLEVHQNMLKSLIQGGEIMAYVDHRTYKNSNGEDVKTLSIEDWDSVKPITKAKATKEATETVAPKVSQEVQEALFDDEDILI